MGVLSTGSGRMPLMPVSPEDFREKTIAKVKAHYALQRTPLLLSHLGAELKKRTLGLKIAEIVILNS